MKIQEINPSDVDFNPVIAARAGDVDKANVADIAQSYVMRREAGQIHQIQPGVVRSVANRYQVIVGRHRLVAAKECNEQLGKGEEPFLFHAIVVRDGDEAALITAITENEKRKDSTIFDRGDAMQRLLDLGKSQDQIAAIYNVAKSTVSATLAAGKLPSKLKKMVQNGDMEPDAALLIATCEDTEVRNEIIEHCIEEQNFFQEMEERISKKGKGADSKPDKGKSASSAAEPEESTGKGKSKTKAKPRINKEAVSRAAKQTGKSAARKAAKASGSLTGKQFRAHLEAMYKDKESPLPKAARELIGKLEGFYDGELSPIQFRNSLVKNCVPDAS